MANLNITNIPAPRVSLIDERTGLMSREWYRFFLNLFVLTGSGTNPVSIEELQLGPPNQPDLTELLIQINQNIAPQYEDQSGNFLAIQGAYLQPVVQTGTIANYNLDGSPTAGGIAYGTGPALAISAAGTLGQVLTSGGAGAPTWAVDAGGSVTSVAQSFTGGLISVAGSPITTSGTLALTVAGISGGVPYFSGAATWATSAALAASAIVLGGGAGAAPATTTTGTGVVTALGVNVGTAGAFVVNGGALGTPSSGTLTSVSGLPLTTGVTGTLPIANGGTNSTATATAGGAGYGTGTAHAYTAAGTSGQFLVSTGASAPAWTTATTLAVTSISFGTTGLTPSTATQGVVTVAGTLAVANGGTGVTSSTGTGDVVLSASPTLTGTLTAATGTFSGLVGIGMTPVEALDITKSQNATSTIKILNATVGTAAKAQLNVASDVVGLTLQSFSSGFTTSGLQVARAGLLRTTGAGATGGLYIDTGAAAGPLVFGVGNAEIARMTATGLAVTGTLSATGAVTGTRFTPTATGNTGLGLAGAGSPGIYVNGTTEAARFDTSGRFLVATTALVNGNSKQSIWVTAGNNALETNSTTTAAYNPCLFYNNSSAAGYISVSGATTAYNTSSDARMKTNVADAASAGELIDDIKVRQFDWKVDGNHQRYGMIAQELLEVAPEAVSVPTDPEQMMGMDYSKLVPMLVKEIQSLRTRLAALESK